MTTVITCLLHLSLLNCARRFLFILLALTFLYLLQAFSVVFIHSLAQLCTVEKLANDKGLSAYSVIIDLKISVKSRVKETG